MAIIVGVALMATMFLMRRTAAGARRGMQERIRWRGIDWSQGQEEKEDRFKDVED